MKLALSYSVYDDVVSVLNHIFQEPNLHHMNTKTLFEIALKIVGLLALWNFLQSLGGIGIAFGIFKMFASGGGLQNQFMGYIAFNMVFTVIIPAIIAFFCLFRTQRLISILKLDEGASDKIALDHRVVYNVLVLVTAVFIFMHGCANCITYSYNRNTNTETNFSYNQDPKSENNVNNKLVKDTTSVNQNEIKNVNYFAFAEIIIAIMLFLKSAEIASWLFRRYNDVSEEKELIENDLIKN